MTLNKKKLRKWEKSAHILLTEEQKVFILNRFGAEPEPYEWTEEDIFVQIRNFLGYGEFVKSIQNNDKQSTFPDTVDF